MKGSHFCEMVDVSIIVRWAYQGFLVGGMVCWGLVGIDFMYWAFGNVKCERLTVI